MTRDAIQLWRKIYETDKKFISWLEIKDIAPPEAITPSKRTLSRRIIRELIKEKKLTTVGKMSKDSVFGVNR